MMKIAMLWRRLSLMFMAIPAIPLTASVAILNVIHPLIHGTPLDSGALDTLLINFNAAGAMLVSDPHAITCNEPHAHD